MRALIVEDGFSRQAVAAVRALHAAGWTVGVASPIRGLAAASRATASWHAATAPEVDVDRFLDDVVRAAREGAYEVVFGARDAEVLALVQARERLGAKLPYPPPERVHAAFDKVTLGKAAQQAGISVPRAWDAKASPLKAPVVVKPRLHPVLHRKGATARTDARTVATRAALERALTAIRAEGGTPIVQELLPGPLIAVALLIDGNGVIARIQQRAERIYPPSGGVSSRARTVAVDEELFAQVISMLRDLQWIGMAQLQFVVPPRRPPHLIDFNGRFYGSLALATSAGVNFPDLWARAATGRPVPRRIEAAAGVRYQWLWGDLRRAAKEQRGGLLRDLLNTLRFARGATHSVWDHEDPGPAVNYVRLKLLGRARTMRPWTRLRRSTR